MIYITDDDLIVDSQERLINESSGGDPKLMAEIEKRVIDYVITKIGTRYNTELIFTEGDPIYNQVLVDIISKMTLYRLYKRNSARKITQIIKDENDWALKELDKINNGSIPLSGLPLIGSTVPGKPDSDTLWGNFSNQDFYI